MVSLDTEKVGDSYLSTIEGGNRDNSEIELGALLYSAGEGSRDVFGIDALIFLENLEVDIDGLVQ